MSGQAKKTRRRRWVAVVLIIIAIFTIVRSNWIQKQLYPLEHKAQIVEQGMKYNVDPHLIASVIRVESNFRSGLESPKGAIGLMQLMPTTAEWIIEQANMKAANTEHIRNDIGLNVELGTWYLRYLLERYDHQIPIVLAAYNAGPGNVNKWLKAKTWDGQYETVKDIPFAETRNYVQKVIYYYNKYSEIYPDL